MVAVRARGRVVSSRLPSSSELWELDDAGQKGLRRTPGLIRLPRSFDRRALQSSRADHFLQCWRSHRRMRGRCAAASQCAAAAGVIHIDIAQARFIRAEVVSCEDFANYCVRREGKEACMLRLEGCAL